MAYVVTLYVEGGEQDGETFVCGSYGTLEAAEDAAEALGRYGSTLALTLHASTDDVASEL